jgi:hypothetical protein
MTDNMFAETDLEKNIEFYQKQINNFLINGDLSRLDLVDIKRLDVGELLAKVKQSDLPEKRKIYAQKIAENTLAVLRASHDFILTPGYANKEQYR